MIETISNSLERMLRVVNVVENANEGIPFEQIHAQLNYTRSTLYRYLKVLTEAEFLSSFPGRGYTLGPRITELDYKMRLSDPLVVAARPIMAALARSHSAIALLCRRYGDKVLCVHQERGAASSETTYERGLARPLLRGAASRIILAHLSAQHLARLFEEHEREFADAGLGETLNEVRSALRKIRHAGWDATFEHLQRGATGVAAPLLDARGAIVGSLSLTIANAPPDHRRIQEIADDLTKAARQVMREVSV